MRRIAALSPLLLLPLTLFAAFFRLAILDVGNAGWLIRGSDNGENALGLHAYLHDPHAGWSLRTTLLDHPNGVPLLFTDSNPLLGALVRPVASWLPVDAQVVGPWLLLCLVLQVLFAWLLLRRYAPGLPSLWLGTLLLAAPPTLFNRYVHANLFAHWLILAALWLFVDPRRRRRTAWWLFLLAITALVHSYLLVMVGAIWASGIIAALVAGDARARRRAGVQVVAVGALIALLARWMGVGGDFLPTHNYGAFAMPLDALWNPATAGYSSLLPPVAQREGRGFEGFQYLGAGVLLLFVAVSVIVVARSATDRERALHRRLRWLVPALAALTLLAISNYPDVAGHRLVRVPLPGTLTPALDLVRASGRLFWPVAYVLTLLAVVAAFRLGRDRATLLLAAAVAVQVIDLAPMSATIRDAVAAADGEPLFVRTVDPRWDVVLAAARDVALVPAQPTRDLALYQEVAWRATARAVPVRTVYAARLSRAVAIRLAAEDAAFRAGMLDAGRLYVLLPGEPVPRAAAARLRVLDGVRVIAPASPRSIS